jgi:hypothetical protein
MGSPPVVLSAFVIYLRDIKVLSVFSIFKTSTLFPSAFIFPEKHTALVISVNHNLIKLCSTGIVS